MIELACRACGASFIPTREDVLRGTGFYRHCPRCRAAVMRSRAPKPEPVDSFTAEFLLEVIRDACIDLDPRNAEAYRAMGAEHVREAVRLNARLLEAHREYQRVYRITRRGRRKHADAIYRYLDVVPQPYLVVAAAWTLLPTALLDPPEPDPSRRSPLRTAT